MTDASATPARAIVARRPLWRDAVRWLGVVVAAIALLIAALVLGLSSDVGRRFVADQVAGLSTASGIGVRIGRIEGSLYGAMRLRNVELRDARGTFATAPVVAVDWRPFAYLRNRIDIRTFASPLVRVSRLPALKPVPDDPDTPILPDIDIDIGSLRIERIVLAPAISGRRHVMRLSGSAQMADGRAQVMAAAAALGASGVAGGERARLVLDAVPDRDRFDMDLKLAAPADGLVAGFTRIARPLNVAVTGSGGWQRWSGKLLARSNGAALASLGIEARGGLFAVRGPVRPALLYPDAPGGLFAPAVEVALDARLAARSVATRLALRSPALSVTGSGVVDFARNRLGDVRLEALLARPGTIAPNLTGNSVRLALVLDGPMATPIVDYRLAAAALGFGDTVAEGLVAEGKARIDADRILVPVRARAARVSGLDAAAGALLTNVAIGGDVALSGDRLLSDNLRIESDRIDATAILAADLGKGLYTGALKGRVNDYTINGLGRFNVTADADLRAGRGGGWGITGRVAAISQSIFSEGVRTFLGGQAGLRSDLAIDPSGVIRFSDMRVNAPRFRLLSGSGSYRPGGALALEARGVSTQYGPISAQVTGSLTQPSVVVRAPRPGLGIGLADVEARIVGRGGAFAILAAGGSSYGPFAADMLVRTGAPLRVDVRSARFAGMDGQGLLRQTSAGPFAGTLDFRGSGVTGRVTLAAEERLQRALFAARALSASIPGSAGLVIGRAVASGSVLFADTPEIEADVQVAGLRQGRFVLGRGRAKVDYRGGAGTAQAFLEGSRGVPYRIAVNAEMRPDAWVAALAGQSNGIAFRTAVPARIAVSEDGYRLFPVRIDLDRGSLRVAGQYGPGLEVQTRLDRFDLAVVNTIVPGLGLGGIATGTVDFVQASAAAFPRADARLDIANFTRTTIASISPAVDIAVIGALRPDGGEGRALFRRGGTAIGRMVATLRPLAPGAGAWTERLLGAPLAGGVRYNGPADIVFALTGIANQRLSGPVGIAADFGGSIEQPRLNGILRSTNLTYENLNYGTRITQLRLDGRFTDNRLLIDRAEGRAGAGTVSVMGRIGLSAAERFPIDLTAKFDNAQLAASAALGARATGELRITNSAAEGGLIAGTLTMPEARYELIRQGAADVPELTGVRRRDGQPLNEVAYQRATPARAPGTSGVFALRIDIRAANRLFVSGMGLESEWAADLQLRGTSAAPILTGDMQVVRGTYSFASRRFDITRGTISFEGGALTDPQLNIIASTTAEGVTANIDIGGSAQTPVIQFTSIPNLPQDEVLSRLLFGGSVTSLSAIEAVQLAAALNSLRGGGTGLNPIGQLRRAAGIDRLRVLGADDATGRGTALSAGKYITRDIYIEIITDARGFTATQLEIALTRALSILSSTASAGGSNVSLRYSRDY